MRKIPLALRLAVLVVPVAWIQVGAAPANEERVTLSLSQPLPMVPGHSFTSVVVDLPPGGKAVPHRHGAAFVYAYVLSGQVRSALEGSAPRTYTAGQDWFEPPDAHHTLTENPSATAPARFLAIFVAPTGATLKFPDAAGADR